MTPDQKRLVLTCLQIEVERQMIKNTIYRTTLRPDTFLLMKDVEYNDELSGKLKEIAKAMPRKMGIPFPLGDNDGTSESST